MSLELYTELERHLLAIEAGLAAGSMDQGSVDQFLKRGSSFCRNHNIDAKFLLDPQMDVAEKKKAVAKIILIIQKLKAQAEESVKAAESMSQYR